MARFGKLRFRSWLSGVRGRHSRIARRSAILTVTLVLSLATNANANFLNPQTHQCDSSLQSQPCLADSSIHTVHPNVGPNVGAALDSTLYGSYDTTNINVVSTSTAHSSTDVYFHYADLPGNVLGRTSCVTEASDPAECDHFHVRFDVDRIIAIGWGDGDAHDQDRLKALACHEVGHTLGLTHVQNTYDDAFMNELYQCMVTPLRESTKSNVGSHNVSHINGHYP